MKTLSVLRHAKSSWEYPDLTDFERPILTKGVKRTLRICETLKQVELIPDLIISSPAVRAHETAEIIFDQFTLQKKQLIINDNFYPGFVKKIISTVNKLDNKVKHAMIVGHNPALTDMANHFLGYNIIDWIPTSGLVTIQFDCKKWEDISAKNATLIHYLKPKELKQNEDNGN